MRLKKNRNSQKKKFPAVELSDLEFFDKINDENLKSKEKLSKYIKRTGIDFCLIHKILICLENIWMLI